MYNTNAGNSVRRKYGRLEANAIMKSFAVNLCRRKSEIRDMLSTCYIVYVYVTRRNKPKSVNDNKWLGNFRLFRSHSHIYIQSSQGEHKSFGKTININKPQPRRLRAFL